MEKTRYTICQGVGLTAVCDSRFKNEFFSVSFLSPLKGSENSLAYLLPCVLVRGCQKYGTMQQMNALLEDAYDADIGTDTYRTGNTRIIRFSCAWLRSDLTFDKSTPESTVLDILSNVILCPQKDDNRLLSKKFTELEKLALLDFAKNEINNKRTYAQNSCISLQLDGDEYSHPKYGSEEEIQAVDNELLTEYYLKMIRNFPIEIYYHGKSKGNEVLERIKLYFSPLLNDKTAPFKGESPSYKIKDDVVVKNEKKNCEQTVISMGFSAPNDKNDKYSFTVLCEILGMSPINRLFMNVREKRGLCYYCDLTPMRLKQAVFITAGIEFKRRNEAKEAILGEIEDLSNGNISKAEFETAKTSLINSYMSFFDSPKDHESIVISSVLGNDYLCPEEYAEKISQVTIHNVVELAKKIKLQTVFLLS